MYCKKNKVIQSKKTHVISCAACKAANELFVSKMWIERRYVRFDMEDIQSDIKMYTKYFFYLFI